MSNQAAWAREIARSILEVPLPRRWAHTQGVARRARSIAPILGREADLIEAAAWLHDIGYSPVIEATGFHPLDGARYLRDVQHAAGLLCSLVAQHSCAMLEAEQRGLARRLAREFPPPAKFLGDALTFCDMTTSPYGEPVSVEERLSEIRERYGSADVVTRFIAVAEPHLIDAVRDVERCADLCASASG